MYTVEVIKSLTSLISFQVHLQVGGALIHKRGH